MILYIKLFMLRTHFEIKIIIIFIIKIMIMYLYFNCT